MRLLILWFAFACAFIMMSQSEGSLDLEALKAKFLPAEYFGMNFTAEDGKKLLREKCQKVSGANETVFLQAQRGSLEFVKCISALGNITAIKEEIEIAKPIGELDTIFHKYCDKRSKVEVCFNNLMTSLYPCLNAEERLRHSTFVGIASNVLGFACQKGGDQIALFYAEQGPECLEENMENINYCMNSSFSEYIPKNQAIEPNNTPKIAFGKKECMDIQDFEKCVLFHLEKCSDITPSNIIESMFKFVKNETQCDVMKPKVSALNARSVGSRSIIRRDFLSIVFLILTFLSKFLFK